MQFQCSGVVREPPIRITRKGAWRWLKLLGGCANVMTEKISTDLLNDLEAFLVSRIDVNIDGLPNRAMILLQLLQSERGKNEKL